MPLTRLASRSSRRHGLTLVEMMVSVALTLMVILAIVRVFDLLGGNVNDSRSMLELSAQLRGVANQMQQDLDRVTVRMLPPLDASSGEGYFELIEGVRSDRDIDGDALLNPVDPEFTSILPGEIEIENAQISPLELASAQYLNGVLKILGDTDDVLCMTIRSDGAPFVGRYNDGLTTRTIQSQVAECIWWISPAVAINVDPTDPNQPEATMSGLAIHRRVLLVRPDLNLLIQNGQKYLTPITDMASLVAFLQNNDVSVRPEGGSLVANSLADLTQRENRFAHWRDSFGDPNRRATSFPHFLNRNFLLKSSDGSDVMLADALAFDLRVYDPDATLYRPTNVSPYVLSPTDPGYYALTASAVPAGQGAFVDLGYGLHPGFITPNPQTPSPFSVVPHPKSQMYQHPRTGNIKSPNIPRAYCTWSTFYERDGIDQDANNLVDEGTNGTDDDIGGRPQTRNGLVDELDEQETSPPYPVPLRGVEVLLRAYEISSQQVRQVTVVGDFVTE